MKQAIVVWILVALGMTFGILVNVTYGDETVGMISGSVVAAQTWAPIAKATVTLIESGARRTTDATGHFTFSDLPPGTYQLRASASGFDEKTMTVTVSAGSTVPVTLPLTSKPNRDNEKKPNYRLQSPAALGTSVPSSAQDSYYAPKEKTTDRVNEAPLYLGKTLNGQDDYKDKGGARVTRQPYQQPYHYEVIPPQPQDMYFRDYGTNDFVDTRHDPKSTFAADINDASYTLTRKYLNDGNMPPTDAIRVQEFVNHFDYGYNPPDEGKFRIFSELADSPFDRGVTYFKIGIKGREIAGYHRKPIRLTAVIDISGSMGYDNRFDILKQSMKNLIERLDSQDQIAIIAYSSYATEILQPTSGDEKSDIMSALYSLYPGGSTFAEAGLRLGFQVANSQYSERANNLVILLSDGVANVGRTSPDAIMAEINQFARKGLTLSTFGFGMGNYNDALLEQLAKQGNGSYAYIDTYQQGEKLFADQLVNTVQTLARDVKIQVEFNPSTVTSYRLIGYENRAVPDQKFRDNRQDGGEVKAGHEVTALYELVLNRRIFDSHVATVNVQWTNLAQEEVTEVSQDVTMPRHTQSFASARPEFRLAVTAARFAEILKGSQYADGCFEPVMQNARRVASDLPSDQTRELVAMVERAQSLSAGYSGYREED